MQSNQHVRVNLHQASEVANALAGDTAADRWPLVGQGRTVSSIVSVGLFSSSEDALECDLLRSLLVVSVSSPVMERVCAAGVTCEVPGTPHQHVESSPKLFRHVRWGFDSRESWYNSVCVRYRIMPDNTAMTMD